ncbi:glucose-6-phosphate dehydrogenase [Ligilactobacillus sp. Marseille-Q7487]|jgi:glucose-6-phosphate 1-dehydrogenase|uniref:glucose-6-phosphate dehydrogenase n=1 Tax=Ligilactobacillus sp. Marseille-Q7487 TaxID=3022128 RepID=UPI0015B58906|nr:glucose-6-phosphate dehydrogenase [Ligilactobacillus sp. Marseille-Q7487]
MTTKQKALFIIFGGTGDLAQRKLYPSLFNLYKKGFLNENFAVIGTARRPWSNDHYQDVVRNSISGMEDTAQQANEFASHFYYQSHNVTDTNHYVTLFELAQKLDEKYQIGGNRLFYLAMSPHFFGTICEHLRSQNIVTANGYNRVIVEKPFGHDLASAIQLNDDICKFFPEEDVFRIDHYLGKEMIQNIAAVRFGNNLFKALWNNRYIDNIQITLSEALGVEERAGYYETSGCLRDMVQNHILQIVALLTMNAPVTFSDVDIRQEKISALKALQVYTPQEVKENFVRGQYTQGNGQVGYRQENQVAKDSVTETFVAGKLHVNSMSFAGVPIYVRSGKRLATKGTRIDVVFKNMPNNIFDCGQILPNVLTFNVDPIPAMSLRLNSKAVSQEGYGIEDNTLTYTHDNALRAQTPEAYEKLLLDALKGDATNFTHWQEVYYSWRFVDAIRQAWDQEKIDVETFPNYECGSMGPKAAFDLLAKDGNHWEFDPCHEG